MNLRVWALTAGLLLWFAARISKQPLSPLKEESLSGFLEGILIGFPLAFLIESFLPIGFRLGSVTFLYGSLGLDPAHLRTLPALGLWCFITTYLGEELLGRGIILRELMGRLTLRRAFIIHLLLMNLVLGPFWIVSGIAFEGLNVIGRLLVENALQTFFGLLFLRTGSLLATSTVHAFLDFARKDVMTDILDSGDTLFFFASSQGSFYLLMVMTHVVACLILFLWVKRRGIRLQPSFAK